MDNVSFATILTSGVLAALATGFFAFLGAIRALKANQPKTEAEADQFQAQANRQNIETQAGVIGTLRGELDRVNARAQKLDDRIAALEHKLDEAEVVIAALERQNTVLIQQNDLLRDQLMAAATAVSALGDIPGNAEAAIEASNEQHHS